MPASSAPVTPLTSRHRLRRLDGRTKEAKFLKAHKVELIQHLGGPNKVTPPQRYLIERVAADLFLLELYDEKIAAGNMTELDGRNMHALRNSVRLALKELGLNQDAPPSRSSVSTSDFETTRRAAALAGGSR
jgi:hypothetical protein